MGNLHTAKVHTVLFSVINDLWSNNLFGTFLLLCISLCNARPQCKSVFVTVWVLNRVEIIYIYLSIYIKKEKENLHESKKVYTQIIPFI